MRRDNESGADLEARRARWGEVIGNLQLLTRTFVSLTLTDPSEIADTLTSLLMTCLGAEHGFTVLAEGDALRVASTQGLSDPASLGEPDAQALWRRAMAERGAQLLPAAELARRWPNRPEALAADAAWVTIDIQEHAIGLLVVCGKLDGRGFSTEDLDFLSAASGVASMAFANAKAYTEQQQLIRSVELRAAEVAHEAQQKQAALVELDRRLAVIEQQRSEIRELSTPMLLLWDNVLALPIIGTVDSQRSTEIMERLLQEITAQQCRCVILDVTGVDVVDTGTADHFVKVVKAAELLGTRCIITGIRPPVAQTLVQLGVDLTSIPTLGTLRDGLRQCISLMHGANGQDMPTARPLHSRRPASSTVPSHPTSR